MTERTNGITLSPKELHVWRCIQERKTPAQIAEEWPDHRHGRTWPYDLIDRLVSYGLVFRAGEAPRHAEIDQEYPWHALADAPILPPGAELSVEYVPHTQRDHRVRPITRVAWPPWDIQGVPFLRPDRKRPKEALPDQVMVMITRLGFDFDNEWQFRASIRQDWLESDTADALPVLPVDLIPGMTRNIATVLHVTAVMNITGKGLVQ